MLVSLGAAGDQGQAVACQQEMLAITESRGENFYRSFALWMGGLIAGLRGDLRRAAAQEAESLRLKRAWGLDDKFGIGLCVEVLAWVTADQQRHPRAATLLGAADTVRTGVGIPLYVFLIGYHDACERQLRDALGAAAFNDAFHCGQDLTYDDVLAYALDEPLQPAPARHEDASTQLTRREQQIADLIAQGLSNKDIATKLVISQRTAESHVEHILTKLGVSSRTQVAAWRSDPTVP